MVLREEERLKRAFRSILLLALSTPAAALYACSSSSGDSPGTGDQPDATSGNETGAGSEAGSGSDGSSLRDSASGSDGQARDGGPDGNQDGAQDDASDAQRSDVQTCSEGIDASHPSYDGGKYLDAADDGACDMFFEYKGCAPAEVGQLGNGCYFGLGNCAAICGFPTSGGCFVVPDNCSNIDGGGNYILDAASIVVQCTKCLGGRRPEEMGAFDAAASGGSEVGAWFAHLSHLEGASIGAFRTLRAELLAHGAPRELVDLATAAAHDEVRHTKVTAALARRFGATPSLAKVHRGAVRSLKEIALENAAEGCVRETFAALLAAWQAVHATDAEVRRAMAEIAEDETRHAALAWGVAHWAEARLSAEERAEVEAARTRAIDELRRDVADETPAALVAMAGLPSKAAARTLVEHMAQTLWS